MEKGGVLIIEEEADYCIIIYKTISQYNINSYFSTYLKEALKLIKLRTPDIIIADQNIAHLEKRLHSIIDAIDEYDPDVFLIDYKALFEKGNGIGELSPVIQVIKDKYLK